MGGDSGRYRGSQMGEAETMQEGGQAIIEVERQTERDARDDT